MQLNKESRGYQLRDLSLKTDQLKYLWIRPIDIEA